MSNKPVVLYIEDKDVFIRAVKSTLPNCDLRIARNLNEGLENLKSGQCFDLIMVNLNYTATENDSLGVEILEYIKRELPDIPRIVVTGRPGSKPVNEYFFKQLGVSEFFVKGESTIKDLRRIVGNLLDPSLEKQPEIFEATPQIKKIPSIVQEKNSIPHLSQSGLKHEVIRLEIRQIDEHGNVEIKVTQSSQGEFVAKSQLKINPEDLFNLLWHLQNNVTDGINFDDHLTTALGIDNHSRPEIILEKVGKALYDSIFIGDLKMALHATLNNIRSSKGIIELALTFDEYSVQIAQFPWELLHDGRRYLLSGGMMDITRYVNYPESATKLQVTPPISVLYLKPRPHKVFDDTSPGDEDEIYRGLSELQQASLVKLSKLHHPTFDNFVKFLESNPLHVLHFDGEGAFGCKCPSCGSINFPRHTKCQTDKCGCSLEGLVPMGYLAFENELREIDWVDSKEIESVIFRSELRLAVLSSCQTSQIHGKNIFNATGPALIQAGVPAVISMQLPITSNAAMQFVSGFYASLARFDALPLAMSNGRRRISRYREWFVPTLYLRSKESSGILFTQGAPND